MDKLTLDFCMNTQRLLNYLVGSILLLAGVAVPAAASDSQFYKSGQILGDGKHGFSSAKWSQGVPERVIDQVVATVERVRGGDDTFVNLRFGSGNTFENGKRVPVRSGQQEVSWNVGAAPNGQPLVLNAYNGEVRVHGVRVVFRPAVQGGSLNRPRDDNRRDSRDDRYGNDRYRNDGYRDDRYRDDRYGDDRYGDDRGNDRFSDDDNRQGDGACARGRYAPPRIEIATANPSGGLFSGKYRVRGSLFGSCVEEFGYFEEGRLKERISFPFEERFTRQDFEIKVQTGRNGELRAFSSNGGRDQISVDSLVQQGGQQGGQAPFGLN